MKQHEKLVKMIEKSKENYFKDLLSNSNAKDTFKTLGVLLNKNGKILPTIDTPNNLCNKFAEFFNEKVARIRRSIENDPVNSVPNVVTSPAKVFESELVSFRELNDKSCTK